MPDKAAVGVCSPLPTSQLLPSNLMLEASSL